MRLLGALVLALSASACGGLSSDPIAFDRAEPEVGDSTRAAVARWTLNASTCPGDEVLPPSFETEATVLIEDDRIELGLATMPVLSGTIESGRAEISGVTTFWQEEWITCAVEGDAELGSNVVIAQVNETLSSKSALNCQQDWNVELDY